jgi:hypothetical protein
VSKALSEDSEGKRASSNEFGTRQLFRRPAPPSGSTTFAWARFQRKNTSNVTVTSANNTTVVGTAGDDLNTDPTIFQINAHSEIQMLVAGLIGIYGQTVWSTYTTSFRQVSVWDTAPAVDYPIAMDGSSDDLYDPVIVSGIVRVPLGAKLKLVVHQHSGAGQSLYGGGTAIDEINFLEIQYLGSYQ